MGTSPSTGTKSISTSPSETTEGQVPNSAPPALVCVADPPARARCRGWATRDGARRLANHELAVEHDPLRASMLARLEPSDERFSGSSTELLGRLGHCGEVRPECVGPGEREVVETHQGDVVGHGQAAA